MNIITSKLDNKFNQYNCQSKQRKEFDMKVQQRKILRQQYQQNLKNLSILPKFSSKQLTVSQLSQNQETSRVQSKQLQGQLNGISVRVQTLQQFKYQQTMEVEFQVGEIVWAKIIGFPWWPGAIHEVYESTSAESTSYMVKFFGEDSHSTLSSSKLAKYSENKSTFVKKAVTCKQLRDSINVAQNILQGKSSIDYELTKIKQKTTLMSRHQASNSMDVEIQIVKQTAKTEFAKSLNSDTQLIEETNQTSSNEFSPQISLDIEDERFLEEIENKGIDEKNVIEILESGILKRVLVVMREKGERLQRIAKKALIRKYFLKRIPQKSEKDKNFRTKTRDTLKQPILRKKIISKSSKSPKQQLQKPEIQLLCVKRIFQILKMFQIDSQSSRVISSNIITKLKSRHNISSLSFQREFLSCIQWIKHHSDNCQFIKTYYDRSLPQYQMQQQSKQSQQTAELTNSHLQY